MKTVSRIIIISMAVLLWNCQEADKEYIHDKTTIDAMICRASHTGSSFEGQISEYHNNGILVQGELIESEIVGGYGRILFEVSQSLQDDVDLTNIYLIATLTWDQSITPSLSGRHDITGEGIVVTVKSGIGTTRSYRIQGEYK